MCHLDTVLYKKKKKKKDERTFYGEDGGRMAESTREIAPEQAAQLNLRIFWSSPIIERVVVMAVVKVEFRGIRVLPES